MHQISLDDIRLVNQIARVGSFARAADTLSLPRPSVTRRVKQLEQFLGVSLFQRSTRKLALTPEGEAFLQHSQTIEAEWKQVTERMKTTTGEPSGRLRVSALGLFNRVIAGPVLSQFVRQYPKIDLQLKSTWSAPDATKFDVDLMLNTKPLDDKSFVNEPLSLTKRDFYASPDYLNKAGFPKDIKDLCNHDLVALNYTDLNDGEWYWQDGDQLRTLQVRSHLSLDEAEAAVQMTLLGHGICWLPDFCCQQYLDNGQLARLFDGRFGTPGPLWAIYPRTPFENHRMRLFIEMARASQLLGEPAPAKLGKSGG
ncbi:DNA-binding transcriptional regulator, LysR family [Ferrimonas sediminum]|uniref:DNA-binding transcriptional regulator, LysR family n=1 Tax=Ferrimonas sediminum TaxID=718193 RepID=A0A1G9BEV2_9GAMM|nr:LysR family transcriptional regulator [Ferrimonas sediminum]SDK38058.1 DNA-binding transcriptional regulator, LysR family [Ferrimonas sediminum]